MLNDWHICLIDRLVSPECSFSSCKRVTETHLGTKLATIFLVFPTYLEDRKLEKAVSSTLLEMTSDLMSM